MSKIQPTLTSSETKFKVLSRNDTWHYVLVRGNDSYTFYFEYEVLDFLRMEKAVKEQKEEIAKLCEELGYKLSKV